MDKFYSIWIQNNTHFPVYYLLEQDYPDTLLPSSNTQLQIIQSGRKEKLTGSNHKWEDSFKEYFPNDTLIIFLLNADTINKYSWNVIQEKNKIIKWKVYSLEDLESNNWTITYP
jgi:hypothetical protein